MLVAIIFGGFENITIWLRFNLAISLKESGWVHIFFNWRLLTLAKFIISPFSPNKSSPIIYHFTVYHFGQGSKGINFSGWHGLEMSTTMTKETLNPNKRINKYK